MRAAGCGLAAAWSMVWHPQSMSRDHDARYYHFHDPRHDRRHLGLGGLQRRLHRPYRNAGLLLQPPLVLATGQQREHNGLLRQYFRKVRTYPCILRRSLIGALLLFLWVGSGGAAQPAGPLLQVKGAYGVASDGALRHPLTCEPRRPLRAALRAGPSLPSTTRSVPGQPS
jgi:hypothetical protein